MKPDLALSGLELNRTTSSPSVSNVGAPPDARTLAAPRGASPAPLARELVGSIKAPRGNPLQSLAGFSGWPRAEFTGMPARKHARHVTAASRFTSFSSLPVRVQHIRLP